MQRTLTSFRDRLVETTPALTPGNPVYPWLVLIATSIGTFMAVLDGTIVNIALAKLETVFGVSTDEVQWVITGYMLVFGVMLAASGWLSDRFGQKTIFLLSLILFTVGSFLCSLSWNITSLIFFRVVQGAGGGLIQPVGMAIITREFPKEKRGLALGIWAISSSASISLGPTVGGWLIDNFSWHTIFDVNVPIGIVGVAASYLILRERRAEESREFDLIGFVSMSVFLMSLLLGLSDGNASWNADGWHSPFILGCFVLSGIALVVFLVTEFTTDHPLVDLSLFKNYDFTLSNIVLFLFGLGMFGSIFLQPLYLQEALGYTPLQAGLITLPMGLLVAMVSPLAGILTDRFGGKVPVALGLLLMAGSLYEYRFLSVLSEQAQILIPVYVRGIGMGLIFSPISAVAISEIPGHRMAQASGLINVLRQIGGSFGVAILSTLFTRRVIFHADTFGQAMSSSSPTFREVASHLATFATQATGGTLADGLRRGQSLIVTYIEKQAFVAAIDDVFLVAAAVVGISIIPVLLLRNHRRQVPRGADGARERAAATVME